MGNPAPVENSGLSHYFGWVSTIQGGAGFRNHPRLQLQVCLNPWNSKRLINIIASLQNSEDTHISGRKICLLDYLFFCQGVP